MQVIAEEIDDEELNALALEHFANLLGASTRLVQALTKDGDALQVSSTAGFEPTGFVWVDRELIDSRVPASFGGGLSVSIGDNGAAAIANATVIGNSSGIDMYGGGPGFPSLSNSIAVGATMSVGAISPTARVVVSLGRKSAPRIAVMVRTRITDEMASRIASLRVKREIEAARLVSMVAAVNSEWRHSSRDHGGLCENQRAIG